MMGNIVFVIYRPARQVLAAGMRTVVTGGGGTGAVDSVNGQTGVVVLTATDVGADTAGTGASQAASAVSTHVAASDPHPQYLTPAEGDARYERNLTAGANITIDRTNPAAPVISASGGGGAGGAVDSVNGQTGVVVLDTDDIAEGVSNLYFTNGRAAAAAPVQTVDGQTGAVSLSSSYAPLSHVGDGGAAHSNAVAAGAAGFMTGADKTKLDGIATGATQNSSDTFLRARGNHTGTQLASTISDFALTTLATLMAGFTLIAGGTVLAADSLLVAIGKLQKQINDLFSGKQDTLVSGTNIKTVNGSSLLGTGNLDIAGGGMTNPMTTAGDLIVGGAAGVPARLAAGTNAYVLTMVAGAPVWGPPSGAAFTGGTLTSALNEAPPVTLASAGTVPIGAASANSITISGTTTVTAFDTIAAGAVRHLVFTGVLTLTHNATSLILPTGANIVTAAGDVAEFRSLGSGNWRCVGYLRADGTPLAGGGGGGLTNFTEAKNIAAPNATIPVVSLSVTITETNGDVAIVPKGNGAFCASVSNNSAVGGGKRGVKCVDLQLSRTSLTQIASGNYSTLVGGRDSTSSNDYSTVVGGIQNAATGQYSAVFGGGYNTASGTSAGVFCGNTCQATAETSTVVGGQLCIASGVRSAVVGGEDNTSSGFRSGVMSGRGNLASGALAFIGGGSYATTRGITAAQAHAAGRFSATGDAQRGCYGLFRATADATPAVISADNTAPSSTNQVVLPNNSAYTFAGKVVARENATGDCAAWEFKGLIRRGANAAATALVAAVTPTSIAADAGASTWVVAVTADTTNGGIAVTVTGEAAHTIRWVADIETVEVVG